MKRVIGIFFILFLLVSFITPVVVFAQVGEPDTIVGGLVPCGLSGNLSDQCQFCHLIALIQNVINFIIIYLAAPVATLLIAFAGIKLVTQADNEDARREAKQLLLDIMVGFLWILLAWFAVIAVLNILLRDKPQNAESSWFRIKCFSYSAPAMDFTTGGVVTQVTPISPGSYSHQEALSRISGVDVLSTGNCSDRNRSNCTSLEGMMPRTIEAINAINTACRQANSNCSIAITGGTEVGHTVGDTSHSSGHKFDISARNENFNSYMTDLIKSQNNITGSITQNQTYNVIVNGRTIQARYETNPIHWDFRAI